jgi:hypothetical protein
MSNEKQRKISHDASFTKKRKRKDGEDKQKIRRKRARKTSGNRTKLDDAIMSVDQLAWKKISLENDEFEDFEEIEGVDVEYVEKDGNRLAQFKVGRYFC